MPHVFKTFDKDGNQHPRLRYRFTDWRGRLRSLTGTEDWDETKALADRRQAFENEIRDGIRPKPKKSDNPIPIENVIAEHLKWGAAQGGHRGHGWAKDHYQKRKHRLAFWKERLSLYTLDDIELPKVEKALRELGERGRETKKGVKLPPSSGKTLHGYAEALKALCIWAKGRGYIEANPLEGLGGFNVEPKMPHRELSAGEVAALLNAAPPERNLLYRVALATGYRQNELRCLTVRNLDRFGPALSLPAQYTKNRRAARQFISSELAQELAALAKDKAEDAPLLDMPQKETCSENFVRDVAKAKINREIKGLGKATFHSLRVNYINAVVASGADLKSIMTLARHSSASMSMETYAKPKPDTLRNVATAAANLAIFGPENAEVSKQKVAGAESIDVESTCEVTALGSNPRGDARFIYFK